jgi:hypothetical protein
MLYHHGCRFLSAVGHPIDAETEKLGSGQAVLEALIDAIVERLADIHETVGTKLDEISVRRRIKFRAGPLKMDDDGAKPKLPRRRFSPARDPSTSSTDGRNGLPADRLVALKSMSGLSPIPKFENS